MKYVSYKNKATKSGILIGIFRYKREREMPMKCTHKLNLNK